MTRLTKEDILTNEPYLAEIRKYNATGVYSGTPSRLRGDSSEDQRDLILRQNPHQKIPWSKVTDSRDSNWRDNTSSPMDEDLLKEEKNDFVVQWTEEDGAMGEEIFSDIGRAEQLVRQLDERGIVSELIERPKKPETVTPPFDKLSISHPKVIRQPGSRTVPRGVEWYRRRGMLQPGGLLDPDYRKLTPEERRRVDVEYYRTRPLGRGRKGEEVEKWCEIRHREPQYTPTKTPTGGEGDDDDGGLSPEERERRKKLKKILEQTQEVEVPSVETKSEVIKFKLPLEFIPYSKTPEMRMPHRYDVYEGVLKVVDHYGHVREKEVTKLLEQDYNITDPSEQLQIIEEMLDSGLIVAVKDPAGQKFKRPEYREVIEREEKKQSGIEIVYPSEEREHEEAEKLREALRLRFGENSEVKKYSVTEAIKQQGFDPQKIRAADDVIGTEKPQPQALYPGIPERIPYIKGISQYMIKTYPRFYGSDIVQQRVFPQVAYDQMPFGEAGKVRDEQMRRTSGRSETERYNSKEEAVYRCVDCKKEFSGYMDVERHIRSEHHSGFEGFTKSEQIVKQRSAEQWYQYSTKDGKRKILGRTGVETKEPEDWNNLSEDVRKKVEVLFETEHKKEGHTYKDEVPVQGEQYGEPGESMLGRVGLGIKQREQSKGPERKPPVPREAVKSFCSLCKEEEESLLCPLCKSVIHSDIENGVFVCPTCVFGLVKISGQEDLEIIT